MPTVLILAVFLSVCPFLYIVCVCGWSMGGLALFFCIVAQQQMVSPCASSPLVFHFLPACTATHRCVFKEIFHNVLHSHHQGVITSSDTAGDWQSPKLTYFHNSKSKRPDLQHTAADLFCSRPSADISTEAERWMLLVLAAFTKTTGGQMNLMKPFSASWQHTAVYQSIPVRGCFHSEVCHITSNTVS